MPLCTSGLGMLRFLLLTPFCLVVSTAFFCKNIRNFSSNPVLVENVKITTGIHHSMIYPHDRFRAYVETVAVRHEFMQ
jgi:hypothetical protein